MMDKEYIEDNGIANKYLRGELTAEELEDFEVYIIDKPELLEELEVDELLDHHLPLTMSVSRQASSKLFSWLTQPLAASFTTLVICVFGFISYLQLDNSGNKTSSRVKFTYISESIMRDGSTEEQGPLLISENDELYTLVLQPRQTSTNFDILMINPLGGEVIQFKDVQVQEGNLVLSVPSQFLSPGIWTFELTARSQMEHSEKLLLRVIKHHES